MAASNRIWTPQQLAGIQTVGSSILVSAAAGSGKTAVLAERCAHLVCDAASPCNIDQLLVVTFTESAAAEMKTRIQQALRDRLAQKYSARLARQVALVEHAHVSTVHGFCNRLLRQNFHRVGLDPNFDILDGDEATLLRHEVASDLFHRCYESDASGAFGRFIDAYGNGNDEQLITQTVAAHELLRSLVNPSRWIAKSQTEISEAATKPLELSVLGKQSIEQIKELLTCITRQCEDAQNSIPNLGPRFAGYIAQLQELASTLRHWSQVLQDQGLTMLVGEFQDFRLPRAPNISGQPPNKEIAKGLLDAAKAAIMKGELAQRLSMTSEQWQQGMAAIAPHANVFLSLIQEFGKEYDQAKASVRALDFADLERYALSVLCEDTNANALKPSPVACALHRQFSHVLVDEYQDINEIQDAILTLASHERAPTANQSGNLFCVGDVKQSIFRFRLAEPARFLKRQERFNTAGNAHGQVIYLRENFRSRAPLLDCVNAVFEKLMTRDAVEIEYDDTHKLLAGKVFPATGNVTVFPGGPIELHLLPANLAAQNPDNPEESEEAEPDADMERADYEAVLVARRILQITGKDGSPPMNVLKPDAAGNLVYAPAGFGDIVILLRSLQFKSDAFADVLRGHDIPVHSEKGKGFFEATEVRDILSLLAVLDNQQQDIPLAAVLRSPLAGLPDVDDCLAQIRLRYRDDKEELPFHQAVVRYAAEQQDDLAARLSDFLEQLDDWRDQANKRPVAELLWRLYDDTGYLAYCAGLINGQQRVANLVQLHQRAAQFGGFRRQGLYRFLRFLENLREQKEVARPSVIGQAEQVVRIMSIHVSKGLEFPIVILPDLGKKHNLQDTHGAILFDRATGLGMSVVDQERLIRYPSLSSAMVKTSLHRQTLAEEMRLLYVAMTRAREHLILVGTCPEAANEKWIIQWHNHQGPLPRDHVLGARTMLDWLGPAAAMTLGAHSPVFQIKQYQPAIVREWQNPRNLRPVFTDRQQKMAELQKLDTPPATSEDGAKAIARFEAAYPFEPFTRCAATSSVTAQTKGSPQILDDPDTEASANSQAPFERRLDLPVFYAQSAPKPTDIGNAMHLALMHWNFASVTDPPQIEREIERLIASKLISSKEASLIDRRALVWMLNSRVGQLLRENHVSLMRELPFALAISPTQIESPAAADPMDQLMVRGRIDLLVQTPRGLVIVDYKTDNVTGPAVAERVALYRGQMDFYRTAIDRVTGRKIAAIYLVFLTPQLIEEV
ncbi:MAG: helicase-exonuclease AddAB subunit AddA [Planctomycetota bacterium]|nr:helicase-exonuclease AddAB subunit AddA [Planctomycetota bacterium]